MDHEELFREFPPVDTQTWKEKIIKDLKGADYQKKLVWRTDEGFTVAPFYREEDLASIPFINTLPGKFPFIRGKHQAGTQWKINELIETNNIQKGNRAATQSIESGAESITFSFPHKIQIGAGEIKELLQGIDTEKIPVHIMSTDPVGIMEQLFKENIKMTGSVTGDPLHYLSTQGKFKISEQKDFTLLSRLLRLSKAHPQIKTIGVDASLFYDSGAHITTSMAMALSAAVFYLDYLTDEGFQPEDLFSQIVFRFAVGSNYFMEIAKFRALRYLWANIAQSYGISGSQAAMTLHAVNSMRNKTIYDPYVNMLRTTTETMSAILGGADEITTLPFDTLHPVRPELGKRIARNQQLILRLESYLDKVADIPAGSYYIENLTKKLADEAWKLFLDIEAKGGYLKAFKKGFISQKIEEEATATDRAIAFRKKNILGVNQYPNLTESINQPLPRWLFHKKQPENTPFTPLVPYREAAAFEALRYQTDRHAAKAKRPTVWMFTYGDLAMRRARAQFAGNFFGCIGYEIIDNTGFDTVEEGIEQAKKAHPDIIVLCSSDEAYNEMALPVFEAMKNDSIVVMAGKPQPLSDELEAKGFCHFIHIKTNVLESLKEFQKMLNIETD